MPEFSTLRLNLMRIGYALMAFGLGSIIWSEILDPAQKWGFSRGIVISLFGALSLLSVLGLRHPVRMLPLLLFELLWKMIWLARIALPAWWTGTIDDAIAQTLSDFALIVIFPFIIPWPYVVREYVTAPADAWNPWRRDGRIAGTPVA